MNALAFTGLAIFWVVSNPETIQKRGSRKCSNQNRFTTGFTQSNARRPVSGRSESVVTQFSGCRVAPTHPEICVLGPNGPRLKVKAVDKVILSNSHREGCTWMGGQINLREHLPKKQALILTRNPLQSCGCMWACSSAGRAPALQAGGHRFDPGHVHQTFL